LLEFELYNFLDKFTEANPSFDYPQYRKFLTDYKKFDSFEEGLSYFSKNMPNFKNIQMKE